MESHRPKKPEEIRKGLNLNNKYGLSRTIPVLKTCVLSRHHRCCFATMIFFSLPLSLPRSLPLSRSLSVLFLFLALSLFSIYLSLRYLSLFSLSISIYLSIYLSLSFSFLCFKQDFSVLVLLFWLRRSKKRNKRRRRRKKKYALWAPFDLFSFPWLLLIWWKLCYLVTLIILCKQKNQLLSRATDSSTICLFCLHAG